MDKLSKLWGFLRYAPHTIGYALRHPIGARQPLRTYGRMLRWQAWSRFRPGLRPVTWVGGARLMARRGLTGVTGNIYYGLHEFWEMALVALALRADDLFADVGANAGSYTILASKVAGARTVALEPNLEIGEIFRQNVVLNGIDALVTLHAAAVGDRIGSVTFSNDLGTMNHIVEDSAGDTVPLTMIDAIFAEEVPFLIKLDVEGGEPAAIAGARATLADPALQILLIETVDMEIERALSDAGLTECTFDPFERRLVAAQKEQSGNNRLFVRNIEVVARRIFAAAPLNVLGARI